MKLGEAECDENIAYFLKYGKIKPLERTCKYGLTDDDIDYYIHDNKPDEYYCWQGTRIPCWFE